MRTERQTDRQTERQRDERKRKKRKRVYCVSISLQGPMGYASVDAMGLERERGRPPASSISPSFFFFFCFFFYIELFFPIGDHRVFAFLAQSTALPPRHAKQPTTKGGGKKILSIIIFIKVDFIDCMSFMNIGHVSRLAI